MSKLDQWEEFGRKLTQDITQIKEALATLVGTGKFDLLIVKGLLLDEHKRSQKTEFSRDEVLDLWLAKERGIGNKKSTNYLKDQVLRPRLSSVILILEENLDVHIHIVNKSQERGRPKKMLCLTV
ncbi:MAG: hypothetical protein ACTSP4_01605 [Candidatus Hodarchaeales archaeon]